MTISWEFKCAILQSCREAETGGGSALCYRANLATVMLAGQLALLSTGKPPARLQVCSSVVL